VSRSASSEASQPPPAAHAAVVPAGRRGRVATYCGDRARAACRRPRGLRGTLQRGGRAQDWEALPERERESLARALRARPAGSEPLSIVNYLYLGQLPPLLFATDAWQDARHRLGGALNGKQRLQSAVGQIAPVRNEIAHVREVDRDRLLRASVACADVLEMLQGRT
jgi:hypothetical protein